jgi:hypothetical protein
MDIAVLINCRQDRVWHQHVNSVHPFRSVFFVAASSSTIQSKRQRKRQYNYTSVHALLITHKSLSSLKASGSTNRPAAARRHLLRLRDDAMPRDGHILPGSRENVTRPFFFTPKSLPFFVSFGSVSLWWCSTHARFQDLGFVCVCRTSHHLRCLF